MSKLFPSKEIKKKLYNIIREKIPDEDATVMVQTQFIPNGKDGILVSLSPTIVDQAHNLPETIDIFRISYRELEPFNFSKEIDKVL